MEPEEDVDFDESNDTKYWSNWTTDYFEDIDTSEYPFPNTIWHVKPTKEVTIKTISMLLIGIPGIFLNSVVLLIIYKNRWLWSATNFLIFYMALIDFLTLLLCPWFMLVRDFYQNYVLRNFGCRFEGFLQATLLLASVGALCLVCYDRLAIAALTADARITRKAAPKLIYGSSVICGALSIPWIVNRKFIERVWLDHVEMYCAEDVQVLGIYWHFTLSLLVWIPLGLMVLTYGAIIWRLECSVRELTSRGGGRTVARVRGRALRITAFVLLAGVVCRVPYTVLMYWRNNMNMSINAVEGYYNKMWFAANYLMYANSAINPLLYGFTNMRFKKAMDRTMPVALCKFGSWCCVLPKVNQKQLNIEEKNTERIFVIESSPKPNKKLKTVIKNILHINRDTVELSGKQDESTKPTKVTPLKNENI